tara:strand:+ start:63754 stop:64905 length:1152 start_codon:yes stop_codon:yes gene_type:complete
MTKSDQPTRAWFSVRKLIALLLIAAVFFLAPSGLERWRTKALVETIRKNGGRVNLYHGLCFNGYCLQLPKQLDPFVGKIYSISLRKPTSFEINDAFIDSLSEHSKLYLLYLGDDKQPTTITDEGLDGITKHPLSHLYLSGGLMTDAGFNKLKLIPSLEYLDLHNLNFTGEQFDCALQMKKLKSIRLSGLTLSNQGLQNLAAIPNLNYLNIKESRIDADGLRHFSNSKKLFCLNFENIEIRPESLDYLAGVTSQRYLGLQGKSIDDSHAPHIAKLNQITFLMLHDSHVTDEGLIPLTKMQQLHTLFLANTPVTDKGINHLTHSPSLMLLDLSNTAVTDKVKESLLSIPKLQRVNLTGTNVSAKTIQTLQDAGIEVMTNKPGFLH